MKTPCPCSSENLRYKWTSTMAKTTPSNPKSKCPLHKILHPRQVSFRIFLLLRFWWHHVRHYETKPNWIEEMQFNLVTVWLNIQDKRRLQLIVVQKRWKLTVGSFMYSPYLQCVLVTDVPVRELFSLLLTAQQRPHSSKAKDRRPTASLLNKVPAWRVTYNATTLKYYRVYLSL